MKKKLPEGLVASGIAGTEMAQAVVTEQVHRIGIDGHEIEASVAIEITLYNLKGAHIFECGGGEECDLSVGWNDGEKQNQEKRDEFNGAHGLPLGDYTPGCPGRFHFANEFRSSYRPAMNEQSPCV
jgi:hypothetical protein